VRHAGRTLALVESSYPYQLTSALDTIGPYDFGGRLRTAMTAHPKTCPSTGELHFFGYSLTAPYLTYHRADATGELVISRPIDVPAATMNHDFHLSAGHVVFMDLPVVFDLDTARSGAGMPFRWDDGYAARLGVLRRDDPSASAGPVRFPRQLARRPILDQRETFLACLTIKAAPRRASSRTRPCPNCSASSSSAYWPPTSAVDIRT
jgi:carotenoid cleavage dioxygenase-like enzyme